MLNLSLSTIIGTLSTLITVVVMVAHIVYADMIAADGIVLFFLSLFAVLVVYIIFMNITIASGLISPSSVCMKALFGSWLLGLGFNAKKPAFAPKH